MSDISPERLLEAREQTRQILAKSGYKGKEDRQGKTQSAIELEGKGYKEWLKTLGAKTFTKPFAFFHDELWEWYWPITQKRLRGERLSLEDLIVLYMLGRENGKSSHIEWACIAEGALLGKGYVMYVAATEAQAKDHVSAIRSRLESSAIAEYYPNLSNPEIGKHGFRRGWSQEYLATKSGWGIIPVGLDEGVRGGRKDDMRFSAIVLDDIDDFKDSPAIVEKKINTIARSILPAGTEDTIILFPQNLIHENSVLNQIYTRRSDVLSIRREIGPYPSFQDLELELKDEESGRVWDIKSCEPTWPALDILSARKYLSKYGRNAFLAEFQHDFESNKEGRVLRNYDDALMVITEDDFAGVFGSIGALDSFNKYVGHDWSRTKSAYHANVAGKLAVSNQNSKLPGKLFLFDLMSFDAGTQADDVALRILESVSPLVPGTRRTWRELIEASVSREGLELYVANTTRLIEARRDVLARVIAPLVGPLLQRKRYVSFRGSHEQNKDALEIYRRVYGLPFKPCNPEETGGLEWADHYMTVDKKTRHPFFEDVLLTDGTWQLGCPGLFIVVKNHKKPYPQVSTPDALEDSDLWRYQFKGWRMRPAKLTESGMMEYGPMKMLDDAGQCLQQILFGNQIGSAPLTEEEQILEHAPQLKPLAEMKAEGRPWSAEQQMSWYILRDEAKGKVEHSMVSFDFDDEPY